MKKIILTLALLLILTPAAYSADGDISQTEVKPDVSKWIIDTFECKAISKQCVVTYRKVDASDNPIGQISVLFRNVVDNPATPQDETDNSFNQLINLINNGDNIKTSLKTAVETKLGL